MLSLELRKNVQEAAYAINHSRLLSWLVANPEGPYMDSQDGYYKSTNNWVCVCLYTDQNQNKYIVPIEVDGHKKQLCEIKPDTNGLPILSRFGLNVIIDTSQDWQLTLRHLNMVVLLNKDLDGWQLTKEGYAIIVANDSKSTKKKRLNK